MGKEIIPVHMTLSRRKWRIHFAISASVGLVLGALFVLYTPLLNHLYDYPYFGLSTPMWLWQQIVAYNWDVLKIDVGKYHKDFLHSESSEMMGMHVPLVAVLKYISAFLVGAGLGLLGQIGNPHINLIMKDGEAAWCDDDTLENKIERTWNPITKSYMPGQIGIEGGKLMALGLWAGRRRKGQMVRMIETLSTLCIAPPGTGKTAGFIIPSIVTDDNVSYVCNDPKPELYEATGGYRQTITCVYMLNWSKVDHIDEDMEKTIFYPRFNFLSPKLVPPPGPDRDTYIDALTKTLIPEPKGGADTYFVNKGRAALTGFCHYLIAKITDANNMDDLPEIWKGKEPSLPMLTDWMAVAQMTSTAKSTSNNDGYDEPQPESSDKMGDWIRKLTDQVTPTHDNKITTNHFPSPRAYLELSTLVPMAEKERSGVLGTMDQALLPFKNEAVKQRTSATDFTADDLRGVLRPHIQARTTIGAIDYLDPGVRQMRAPDGSIQLVWNSEEYRKIFYDESNWMPVTLYICIDQSIAGAFSAITSLLYEVLANSSISLGPFDFNVRTQRVVGPYKIVFALDEFAKLPKTEKLLEGPDLARSKGVSFMYACQSFGQLEQIYSKAEVQTIIGTTAVKYVLTQNDVESATVIKNMAGKVTIQRSSKTTQEGLQKGATGLAWSAAETIEGVDFLRTEDITSIPKGKHIVIVQGYLNKPMMLDTPLFFQNTEMLAKVRSRGKGPIATQIVPEIIRQARLLELKKDTLRQRAAHEQSRKDDRKLEPNLHEELERVNAG